MTKACIKVLVDSSVKNFLICMPNVVQSTKSITAYFADVNIRGHRAVKPGSQITHGTGGLDLRGTYLDVVNVLPWITVGGIQ